METKGSECVSEEHFTVGDKISFGAWYLIK